MGSNTNFLHLKFPPTEARYKWDDFYNSESHGADRDEAEEASGSGGEMDISETHQCYVYGQCQVTGRSVVDHSFMSLNHLWNPVELWRCFLFLIGIFHRLQPTKRCRGLPLLLRQDRRLQMVVLGASSVPLPGIWKLHWIRTPEWHNLPWLYQWRESVSIVDFVHSHCILWKKSLWMVWQWKKDHVNQRYYTKS